MTHDTIVRLVGTYGQLYMIALFIAVLAFTLWPRKGHSLDEAARIPLSDTKGCHDDAELPPCCRGQR